MVSSIRCFGAKVDCGTSTSQSTRQANGVHLRVDYVNRSYLSLFVDSKCKLSQIRHVLMLSAGELMRKQELLDNALNTTPYISSAKGKL